MVFEAINRWLRQRASLSWKRSSFVVRVMRTSPVFRNGGRWSMVDGRHGWDANRD